MSAIGAIFSTDGVRADELKAMASSLGQVPHDQSDTWLFGKMGLAACTLHTNAESKELAQPAISDDGKVAAVFDGHLLNPDEIATDLEAKGVHLRTRSDVEIVLRAYEAWDERCADRFLGEYSLIVADGRKNRIFATRDHMGFLPLYYREEQGRVVMASDLRTIGLLSDAPLEPDHNYLAQVITKKWFMRDTTPWVGVKRLTRAHTFSYNGDRVSLSKYWVPPTDISIRYKTEKEYAEHYRQVLFDCVRRSSRCDAPVGVAVSGGLDSSSLYCVADRLEKDGRLQAPGFRGYSLAAEEGGNAFELPYARAVADHLGRELTEVPLFDPDIDWYTKDAAWHRGIPVASNGAMMLGMERQAVADGSRVMISGTGGDEWLQGNTLYYREFIAERDFAGYARAFGRNRQDFGWLSAIKGAFRQSAPEFIPDPIRRGIRKQLRKRRRRADPTMSWIAPELRRAIADAEEVYEADLPESAVHWSKHNIATSPFTDLSHSLMRRQRSAIGFEARHPMLSRAFMEFSLQTPSIIKSNGAVAKALHRTAMRGILPEVVLERRTKANFTNTKIDHQFAEYVRANAREQLAEICDFEAIKPLLEVDFNAPEGDYWAWEIWGLYASAAFLYQDNCVTEINPATGVQQDRN
ncbi:asparagine synthase-related protein [Erythrobacter sp. Alg231-14]|uniref:asparagine synthase-related protein n=1 Tax=Erythrobacter sp. Alg231-14 TaxID=1922225 RepID=UPI000D55ECD0